jgi:hypothetical protein
MQQKMPSRWNLLSLRPRNVTAKSAAKSISAPLIICGRQSEKTSAPPSLLHVPAIAALCWRQRGTESTHSSGRSFSRGSSHKFWWGSIPTCRFDSHMRPSSDIRVLGWRMMAGPRITP